MHDSEQLVNLTNSKLDASFHVILELRCEQIQRSRRGSPVDGIQKVIDESDGNALLFFDFLCADARKNEASPVVMKTEVHSEGVSDVNRFKGRAVFQIAVAVHLTPHLVRNLDPTLLQENFGELV